MKQKNLLILMTLFVFVLSFAVPVSATDEPICATVRCGTESKDYTSFKDAWNKAVDSAGSGKNVVFILQKNWKADSNGSLGSGSGFSENGAIHYNKSSEITFDLNGCSVDRNIYTPIDGGAVIYLDSKMTIIDSKPAENSSNGIAKGGIITGGANNERGGGIVVSDNATLNFNGGTILNCVSTDDGGAISVQGEKAVLNVDGGSFYGNRTYDASGECCGGAVYGDGAKINIKNSVFEGNYAEDNGGAVYSVNGKLDISLCKFYSNSSEEEGGAIYTDGECKTNIENSALVQNKSDDNGGAVYIDSDAGTYFNNCLMYGNISALNGGAIFVNGDKTFVIGGEYKRNSAEEYGGGIYVDSMYDINVAGKLVIGGNTVKGKSNNLCLHNGNFSTAYLYCGGFYEGSSVSIGSTDNNSRLVISGIDKFQYNNYIHFDDGFTADKIEQHEVSREGIRAEGSALGNGNIIVVSSVVGLALLLSVVMIIYAKRRKKGGTADVKQK